MANSEDTDTLDSNRDIAEVIGDPDFWLSLFGSIVWARVGGEFVPLYGRAIEGAEMLENQRSLLGPFSEEIQEAARDVTSFLIYSHALIDELMLHIVHTEVIAASKQTKKTRETLDNALNYHQRRDLLFHSGVIDTGTNGELKKVGSIRNSLVHELNDRLSPRNIGSAGASKEVERTGRALEQLLESYYESSSSEKFDRD